MWGTEAGSLTCNIVLNQSRGQKSKPKVDRALKDCHFRVLPVDIGG